MLKQGKHAVNLIGLLFVIGMLVGSLLTFLLTNTTPPTETADAAANVDMVDIQAEASVPVTEVDCANYPHWDCEDPALAQIDAFIQTHQGKGYVAATDWDGTLYSESITIKEGDFHSGSTRSGQSLWHLWGAENGYFPAFDTVDGEQIANIVRRDDYLEGKTDVALSAYSKFAQIATFEMGMTPLEVHEGVQAYLEAYPTEDYAYFKMLDVIQQLANNGFEVWVITGSNPYVIATLLADLDDTMDYTLLDQDCDPIAPDLEQCQIVGNAAKQSPSGTFTVVYDDRFVRISDPDHPFFLERNIVDGPGKAVAIQNYIETQSDQPIVFYAGNSGGDYEAIQYILSQEDLDTLAVTVNPRGTLLDLVAKYAPGGMLVEVSDAPAVK